MERFRVLNHLAPTGVTAMTILLDTEHIQLQPCGEITYHGCGCCTYTEAISPTDLNTYVAYLEQQLAIAREIIEEMP